MMANKKYDESNIQVLTAEEHIRKRPGMYIGSLDHKGLVLLLTKYCSSVYHVLGADDMKIELDASIISVEVNRIVPGEFYEVYRWQNAIFEDRFYVPFIKILSSSFEITYQDENRTHIQFQPDSEIWKDAEIPFDYLNTQFYEFAASRKKTRVTLLDKRDGIAQQSYHHYPEGGHKKQT